MDKDFSGRKEDEEVENMKSIKEQDEY